MSQVIDQPITPAPVQGSSGQPSGTPSASADLGSFIASIGAVSGALTELLGVVNYNSSKISEFAANMEKGTMAFYETTQEEAQTNLENSLKETKHKNWFHQAFQVMMKPGGSGIALAAVINKAFPDSKIANKLTTGILLVAEPYKELSKVLPHELAKILPESVDHALGKVIDIAKFVPEHVNTYQDVAKEHMSNYVNTALKETIKGVAYPFYHALKAMDPNMSDKTAHMIADAIAIVVILIVVTVVTDGAGDALVASFAGEEAAVVVGEEAAVAVGDAVSAEVAGDIEMANLAEAGEAAEGAEAAEAAEGVEAAGSTSADITNRMDTQRLQGLREQFTQARQTMRTIQNILGLIKGIEQLGNAYFDARMAINTKNMGPIQSNLIASKSVLDQVSQISQANMDNLKQAMEDCFSDINALYNGLAGIMASVSQATRG